MRESVKNNCYPFELTPHFVQELFDPAEHSRHDGSHWIHSMGIGDDFANVPEGH